ncbi:MAG: TetR/AcrR family transcriptional regulator [Anaerovoracaceae bacterium]|jgi:AcrR family transcriptional regulator
MDKKIVDRRIRKTKERLRMAFTDLIMEKNIKEISVKELAELADINRGTFYLHYKDIKDFYEQIQDEMYHDLRQIFKKHLKVNRRTGFTSVIFEVFELLSKNKELCLVILNSKDSDLLSGIIELGKPKTDEEWTSLLGDVRPELYEYYYTFITSGCVGLLHFWLAGGMLETPGEMAKLAQRMIAGLHG